MKLTLNRQVVANLDKQELNAAKGGAKLKTTLQNEFNIQVAKPNQKESIRFACLANTNLTRNI